MQHVEIETGERTDAADLIARCIERDVNAVLVAESALPAGFFELRSGVAGDLVQKLVNYGIRMAIVVPDLGTRSERFREFAREANAGASFRFFLDREAAVAWLAAGRSA